MNDDRCVMNTYMPIIFTKKKIQDRFGNIEVL